MRSLIGRRATSSTDDNDSSGSTIATRTDLAQYPPAFPALVALIYKISGDPSAYSVQLVLWFVDLILSFLLIAGIAFTAFRPACCDRERFSGRALAVVCDVCRVSFGGRAHDVVCARRQLAVAARAQRKNVWLALAAGVALGIACWLRVNPLYLCVGWAIALFVLVKDAWSLRLKMAAAVLAGTVIVIAPIVIRNYLVFPDFTPTGGTIGVNLWEGLGETELGQQHGFHFWRR